MLGTHSPKSNGKNMRLENPMSKTHLTMKKIKNTTYDSLPCGVYQRC